MSPIFSPRSKQPHPRTLQEVIGVYYLDHLFDFVVVDLEADITKQISITARLSLQHPSPIVKAIYPRAVDYFTLIDTLMTAGDLVSLRRARNLVHFPEPSEFRIGYTTGGSGGTGLAGGRLGDFLFETLRTDPLLRKLLTYEPDALTLIPCISVDRSSDILATIVKPLLIDYTIDQMQFLGVAADPFMKLQTIANNWVPGASQMQSLDRVVPVDDLDRPFLLIPKRMCRSGPAITATQFLRDVPPDSRINVDPKLSAKEAMRQQAATDPEHLIKFVRDRMRDPDKYKPRREYRAEN